MSKGNLAAQAPLLACLADLAVSHPDLPGAYFVSSKVVPNELTVQLKSPREVEAWREALGVPVEEIFVDWLGGRPSVEFEATVHGVDFHVYAAYEAATAEVAGAS
ncbi:hypothetical protein [Streptomyces sp. x-80]|uniref:hypothetical protein n=1 Tax=Streptomyces sp. x-80 TaxID=2789282 RepID=UPI003980DFC9